MKVAILAGGYGSRLAEETDDRPKPMVEIGGKPILWHIMKHYAAHDFNRFVVALGYKGDVIKRYFADYHAMSNSLTVDLKTGAVTTNGGSREDWIIDLVETGVRTQTGGRIKRLAPYLDDETFLLTWGDGVSDVNVNELVAFHRSHGRLATVTAVRPPTRFGRLTLQGNQIVEFAEKAQLDEGWINGAFFVLESGIFDYIEDDMTHFEHDPLENLAAAGQLMAYKHTGFWQCMDTLRDKRYLQGLWDAGTAPWKTWQDSG